MVYNTPIVAVGDGPFDVTHHTNTGDRVLNVHIAGPSAPGQFAESYVDMLFVKGFDAGQPIVYLSTDAGQPLTAVLERATYVPALDSAAFNGGDDFLGSARERLFGFINGQTGADNPQAQGPQHLAKDRIVGEGRLAERHGVHQRPAQRRRPAERVRRLPHPDRPPALRRLQPAVGRPTRPVDPQGGQSRAGTPGRSTRSRCSTWPRPGLTCSPASTRPPASPSPTAQRRRHQLRGDRLHQPEHRPPTSPSPSLAPSSRHGKPPPSARRPLPDRARRFASHSPGQAAPAGRAGPGAGATFRSEKKARFAERPACPRPRPARPARR